MSGNEIASIISAIGAVAAAWISNRARRHAAVVETKTDDVKVKVENGESPDTPSEH